MKKEELEQQMTDVNDRFLEIMALLEVLSDIQESDFTGRTVIHLTQNLVKKAFDKMCYCKRILKFI